MKKATESTVLVTGNAGYVGSHSTLLLKDLGYRVVGFDNLSTGRRDFAELADVFVEGDLLDGSTVGQVFDQHNIDAILHCAALALVGESVQIPETYFLVNVGGTANLITAARRYEVGVFVFSSTAATYGEPDVSVITETTPQQPINPYGQSKLAVEQMLWASQVGWGLRPIVFRYFNAAGADPKGRVGEDRDVETHLIPNILIPMAEGRDTHPVTIFGDDYPTPDGTCVRDYIHVWDLAAAHEQAIRHLMRGGSPGAFNLGTGQGYSVTKVVAAAKAVTEREIPVTVGPRRAGDPPRLVTNYDEAQRVLGWRPQHSDLETILGTAWRWHLTRHGR